jgi:hypothetical protein
MRLEVRYCSEDRLIYGEFGPPREYTERWTENWLHFDDNTERKAFHALLMKLKPTVEEAWSARHKAADEGAQKALELWQKDYAVEKAAWDARSKWGKFWNEEPQKPFLEPKDIQTTAAERFIMKAPTREVLLLKDFKCDGKFDIDVTRTVLEMARHLGVLPEFEKLMSKLPPMKVVPR